MSDHPESDPEPVGARVLDLAKRRSASKAAEEIKDRVAKETKEMLVRVESIWMAHPDLESIRVFGFLREPFEIKEHDTIISVYALLRPGVIESVVREYGYKIDWNVQYYFGSMDKRSAENFDRKYMFSITI